MSGEDWLALNQQGRAIAVEYPLRPTPRDIAHSAGGVILERRFASHGPGYRRIAQSLPKLETFFAAIPAHGDPAGPTPFWHNDWFPPLDAISLCALVYMNRPKRYVEIGSGNSTKFVRHLIKEMNLDTKII